MVGCFEREGDLDTDFTPYFEDLFVEEPLPEPFDVKKLCIVKFAMNGSGGNSTPLNTFASISMN